MPLHRNESTSQKTLNFKGREQSCFVKENHHLSREQYIGMAIVSLSKDIKPPPLEFIFKGKEQRFTVNPPGKVKVQWANKDSYRVKHILVYINGLPTIPVVFVPSKRVIFTLDG